MLVYPDYYPLEDYDGEFVGELSELLEDLFYNDKQLYQAMYDIFVTDRENVYELASGYLLHEKKPLDNLNLARTLLSASCFTLNKEQKSIPGYPNPYYLNTAQKMMVELMEKGYNLPEVVLAAERIPDIVSALTQVSSYILGSNSSSIVPAINVEGILMLKKKEEGYVFKDMATPTIDFWDDIRNNFNEDFYFSFNRDPKEEAWEFAKLFCESAPIHQYQLVAELHNELIGNPDKKLSKTYDLVKISAASALHMITDVSKRCTDSELSDFTKGYQSSFARNIRKLSRKNAFGVNLHSTFNLEVYEGICANILAYHDWMLPGSDDYYSF